MQTVTASYQTAVLATERQVRQVTEIVFLDNTMLGISPTYSASSTCDLLVTPAAKAFNGLTAPSRDYAWVGQDIYPSSTLYPVPDNAEVGWWSENAANGSGVFSPAETLTISYDGVQTLQSLRVYGDVRLGYPVDFSVLYSTALAPGSGDWTTLVNVTGNNTVVCGIWSSVPIHARHLRLSISRWSHGNKRAKILEFEASFSAQLTDLVVSASLTKERSAEDEGTTLPYGNSSANELTLVLDNTDNAFYPRNSQSPYYPYLKQNRKIRFSLGLVLPDGSTEYLSQGTFYTASWKASRTSPTVTVTARDHAKRLMEQEFAYSQVYEGKTISQLVRILAEAYGLGSTLIDATTEAMPYAYFAKDKYWTHLDKLAQGETGAVYFNEADALVFENRSHLFGTRLATDCTTGAGSILLNTVYGLAVGDTLYIDDGVVVETNTVSSAWDGTTTVALNTPIVMTHLAGSYVYKRPVDITFQESDLILDIDDQYVLDKARNLIEVKATPLTLPLDGVGNPVVENIFQLDSSTAGGVEPEIMLVPANSYLDKDIFFSKVPVIYSATCPLDITLTTDPEGDLGYLSTSWQPSIPFAWGGKLRITNTKAEDILVIGCLIQGVALTQPGGLVEMAEDPILENEQGQRTYTIESPYIQRSTHALAIAQSTLETWKNPMAPLSLKGRGLPHLQLADHVKVISPDMGLNDAARNNHFFVTRIVLDYDGGLAGQYDLMGLGTPPV
jgi:hypothetical protein